MILNIVQIQFYEISFEREHKMNVNSKKYYLHTKFNEQRNKKYISNKNSKIKKKLSKSNFEVTTQTSVKHTKPK